MTADNRNRLSFGQLGGRHTEEQRFPIERHPDGLHLLINRHVVRDPTGTGIEMVLQGDITPLIGEDVTLGSIKGIRTGHLCPLPTNHLSVSILHLIIIGEGGYRMLGRSQGCCLQ